MIVIHHQIALLSIHSEIEGREKNNAQLARMLKCLFFLESAPWKYHKGIKIRSMLQMLLKKEKPRS